MPRELSQLSNQELWQLFPIILSEHDPNWAIAYQREKDLLKKTVGEKNIARISHIGSTAVAGLIAKPTIDILLEIKTGSDLNELKQTMEKNGYIHSPQIENPPPHSMFLKGYTPQGFCGQVFHVHIRYSGNWPELYFRDYLCQHADVARQYGALKLDLLDRYKHDRDGYTKAKTEFVTKYSSLAVIEYEGRYQPING